MCKNRSIHKIRVLWDQSSLRSPAKRFRKFGEIVENVVPQCRCALLNNIAGFIRCAARLYLVWILDFQPKIGSTADLNHFQQFFKTSRETSNEA